MTKILMIGNSFSQDSMRYLYGIFRSAKQNVKLVNLYIGGCSLYRHYRNMLSEEKAYAFEINGHSTGVSISLKEALLLDEWDMVGIQQCSPDSGDEASYEPYLTELHAYIKKFCPPAKFFINKTWTFAHGCTRFEKTTFNCPEDMFPALDTAYKNAAKRVNADLLIPCGDAMKNFYEIYGEEIYRDGFHANKVFTRYMLACVWYMSLTGKSIEGNTFCDFDAETDEEHLENARRCATETVRAAGLLCEEA